jgi:hypothetical protein
VEARRPVVVEARRPEVLAITDDLKRWRRGGPEVVSIQIQGTGEVRQW